METKNKKLDKGIHTHMEMASIEPSEIDKGYLVSAIVSTYNSESFIRGCLEDLINQTLYNKGLLEIIVIDSGSQENEQSIVREFQKRYAHLRYERTERETLYAAWNRGIKLARGKYITNANTDDRHNEAALEILAMSLENSPDIGLAYGDCLITEQHNETFENNTAKSCYIFPECSIRQVLTRQFFGPQPMWRKSVHQTVGYFNPKYTVQGDYDFFIRLVMQHGGIHIPEFLSLYCRRPDSVERANKELNRHEENEVHNNHRSNTKLATIYPLLSYFQHDPIAFGAASSDLANIYLRKESELPRAIEILTKAHLICKTLPSITNNLAVVMAKAGKTSEAISLLKSLPENFKTGQNNLKKLLNPKVPPKLIYDLIPHPVIEMLPQNKMGDLEVPLNKGKILQKISRTREHDKAMITFALANENKNIFNAKENENGFLHCTPENINTLKQKLINFNWQYKIDLFINQLAEIKINGSSSPLEISVIVVAWRMSDELIENLKAIQKQSESRLEIILVNNGATEGTFKSVQYLSDKYIRLNNNKGPNIGRNIGAVFAEAPILLFLDDDALPDENLIKSHLKSFYEFDIVASRGSIYGKTDNKINTLAKHYYLGDQPFPIYADIEGNTAYRAELFYAVGGWDEMQFGTEGVDLSRRIVMLEPDMRKQIYSPKAIIYHDYASDQTHLEDKNKRHEIARQRLRRKYPDYDAYLASWKKYYKQKDMIIRRSDTSATNRITTISVCIPTYNRSQYITDTVKSALEQLTPECEIVIVDDGSTDETAAIIKPLLSDRVRYINKEHSGAPETRNLCITESQGDYILWLDSDDILLPGTINKHIKSLNQFPDVDVFYGDIKLFGNLNGFKKKDLVYKDYYKNNSSLLSDLVAGNRIPNPGTMVRKTIFEQYGGYDTGFRRAHDYHFWMRIAATAVFKHIGTATVKWRWHDKNMSSESVSYDTRFEAEILKQLIQKHPLTDLFPHLDWNDKQNTLFIAYLELANTFCKWKNSEEALKYFTQCFQIMEPSWQLSEATPLENWKKVENFIANFLTEDTTHTRCIKKRITEMRMFLFGKSAQRLPLINTPPYKKKKPVNKQLHGLAGNQKTDEKNRYPAENLEMNHSRNKANLPLVSVIVPTHNRPKLLQKALISIRNQTFNNFEIIVVNDAGEDVSHIITASDDTRIRYIQHNTNKGLSASRNTGLRAAQGKYIAYLDDDDIYYPDHLATLISFLQKNNYSAAYTDAYRTHIKKVNGKDIIEKKDLPYSETFDRDKILVRNLFPVLCVMHEKKCIDTAGTFDETLTSHEDWDLWIRISRHFQFAHISKITAEYSWNADGSTMSSSLQKDYLRTMKIIYSRYPLDCEQNTILSEHRTRILDKMKKRITALKSQQPVRSMHDEPKISIIIPVFNNAELTRQCLEALCTNTHYPDYEVIIIDNGSTDTTGDLLQKLSGDIKIIKNKQNLGFSKANNQGAKAAEGKYLVFLNNDTIPQKGWLQQLVFFVEQHQDAGVVGCKLLYPDNTVQHCGVSMRYDNKFFRHHYKYFDQNHVLVNQVREVDAVTAACIITPRTVFMQVGMFDEIYLNGSEDIDYCTAVKKLGNKVYYNPRAVVYHLESQTPRLTPKDTENFLRYIKKWGVTEIKNEIQVYSEDSLWTQNKDNIFQHKDNHIVRTLHSQLQYAQSQADVIAVKRFSQILNRIYPVKTWQKENIFQANRASIETSKLHIPKVLFVCHDFPPYRYAGAQLYAKSLAIAINHTGLANVDILHPVFNEKIQGNSIIESKYDGLRVFKLYKKPNNFDAKAISSPVAAELLNSFLTENKYDVIHIHGLGQLSAVPIEIAKKQQLPVIMTLHDYWFLCDQWHLMTPDQQLCSGPETISKCTQCMLTHYIRKDQHNAAYDAVYEYKNQRDAYLRKQFSNLDKVFAPSFYLKQKFETFGLNGIEVNPLGFDLQQPLQKYKHKEIILGYAGQLIRRKGINTIIEAFKLLGAADVKLFIFGKSYDSNFFNQIMKEIEENPNITYHGAYKPEDLPEIFSQIDVTIIPSVMENYPLLVQESFMNQTPVIATETGGIPEVVMNGKNGLLFRVGDPYDLLEKIQHIINNPNKIEEFRDNIAPVRSINEDADLYLQQYKDISSTRPAKASIQTTFQQLRILFYFFKNVHIPILVPIYKRLKQKYPNIEIAFGYMPYAPQMRAGFKQDELKILETFGENMYAAPQDFNPDITFIADSVYPWVKNCGKLVNVGHGVLSKGQYYTDTETARREEQADLVCVPGSYHEQVMKQILSTPVAATGMAKLDSLFNRSINRQTVLQQFDLPAGYRYILFAPTFNDELSAVPFVLDRINEAIPDEDTIMIIKLHGSAKQEYKTMYNNLVQKDKRVIFADELDITPFLALCDIMISDVSSAMMEFAALDKPLILFNNPNWKSYQNYNPEDIEFKWRDIGIQVSSLEEMKDAVIRSFENPKEFSDKRKFYSDQLFANKYDGNAAERIIEAALALLSDTVKIKGAA